MSRNEADPRREAGSPARRKPQPEKTKRGKRIIANHCESLFSPLHSGAAEESRTLDLNLGKVALYQLSYCRFDKPGGASRSRTDLHGFAIRCITALLSRRVPQQKSTAFLQKPFGAAEESRTLDLNLGKVALYQLSYCR
jgi:hypothetical protein